MPDPDLLNTASPAELIRCRCRALAEGDFGFIYDSYHADSYFRRQFPDRSAYMRHGESVLGRDYTIEACRILRERKAGKETRIIFHLVTRFRGRRVESVELALLLRSDEGWRYHSSQKMSPDEAGKAVDAVDFADFERMAEKVFF